MLTIRLASTPAELLAVYRFRYEVYFEEMRQNEACTNHERRQIADPLDSPDAVVLAAWNDDRVVGTSRFNLIRDGAIGNYREYYRLHSLPPEVLHHASLSTRAMVHAEFRRTTLAARLCCAQYQLGLARGVRSDFCDCAPQNAPFFTGLGYRVHREDFIHPEFGPGPVMRLDLHDLNHFVRVRSPFRKFLSAWQATQTLPLAG